MAQVANNDYDHYYDGIDRYGYISEGSDLGRCVEPTAASDDPWVVGWEAIAIDFGAADKKRVEHIQLMVADATGRSAILKFQGSNNSTNGLDGDWTDLISSFNPDDLIGPAIKETSSMYCYGSALDVVSPDFYRWYRLTGDTNHSTGVLWLLHEAFATAPGEAVQSTIYYAHDSNQIHNADKYACPNLFDDKPNTFAWIGNYTESPYNILWHAIDFGTFAPVINYVQLQFYSVPSGSELATLKIQGSNDSTMGGDGTWDDLGYMLNEDITNSDGITSKVALNNNTSYRWYRILGTVANMVFYCLQWMLYTASKPVFRDGIPPQIPIRTRSISHQLLGGI